MEYTRNGFRYSSEESDHSEAFRGLRKSQFRSSERNLRHENWFYKKSCSSKQVWQCIFVRNMLRNRFPRVCFFFVPQNGSSSWFLFRGMVWNGIPRVCIFFCSTVQNSKLFSPLRNDSEWNSEKFLFRGTAEIPPEPIFFVRNCQPYCVYDSLGVELGSESTDRKGMIILLFQRKQRQRLCFLFCTHPPP
jgi:hypothetical protein